MLVTIVGTLRLQPNRQPNTQSSTHPRDTKAAVDFFSQVSYKYGLCPNVLFEVKGTDCLVLHVFVLLVVCFFWWRWLV